MPTFGANSTVATWTNTGPMTPTKTPEFELVSNELDKAIEALGASAAALEDRLASILLQETPTPLKDAQPASVHSQAVARLYSFAERITQVNRRLNDIMGRLEV